MNSLPPKNASSTRSASDSVAEAPHPYPMTSVQVHLDLCVGCGAPTFVGTEAGGSLLVRVDLDPVTLKGEAIALILRGHSYEYTQGRLLRRTPDAIRRPRPGPVYVTHVCKRAEGIVIERTARLPVKAIIQRSVAALPAEAKRPRAKPPVGPVSSVSPTLRPCRQLDSPYKAPLGHAGPGGSPGASLRPQGHPEPEIPGRVAEPGDPVPKAVQQMQSQALEQGWSVVVTYARGTSLTRQGAGPVIDSVLLRARRGDQALAAMWEDSRFRCAYASRGPGDACPPRLSFRRLTQRITASW